MRARATGVLDSLRDVPHRGTSVRGNVVHVTADGMTIRS
jgi:hypothetical protein